MKITELIRDILDVIDGVEQQQPNDSVEDKAYSDRDIKRFKQIVDLADTEVDSGYSNQPNEQYADIDAVTQDAGADSWQGTKHPADIRGEHPSLYPGTVHGAR
jgi:uncharacterized membrane protein